MKFEDIQRVLSSLPKIPQAHTLDLILKSNNLSKIVNSSNTIERILKNNLWNEKILKINKCFNFENKIINYNNFTEIHYNNNYYNIFKHIEKDSNFEYIDKISNSFRLHSYDFADLLEGFEEESTEVIIEEENLSINNIIFEETSRIKKIIFEIYLNNECLYKLHPREFEKLIAELLHDKGFEVELTKQTRDNGYDILAMKYLNGFSPIKYLVECKKYAENRKIGVDIIRGFKEVLSTEQANKGLIVTTSYFTKDAIKKQQETPLLLEYKDKDEVIDWVNQYYNQKNIYS